MTDKNVQDKGQVTKQMKFEEKVRHIKHDLQKFLDRENTEIINNSIYLNDNFEVSYNEMRQVVSKVCKYERLYKDTLIPPSPQLAQIATGFMGMQMMMPNMLQFPMHAFMQQQPIEQPKKQEPPKESKKVESPKKTLPVEKAPEKVVEETATPKLAKAVVDWNAEVDEDETSEEQ